MHCKRRHLSLLEAIGAVLAAHERSCNVVPWGDGQAMRHLAVYTREWAGDRSTRLSASCAFLQVDRCLFSVIGRGQHVRAQPPAEAGVFAAVLGMKALRDVSRWVQHVLSGIAMHGDQ